MGPYEVTRKEGKWSYVLRHLLTNQLARRNYNQIKKVRVEREPKTQPEKQTNSYMPQRHRNEPVRYGFHPS